MRSSWTVPSVAGEAGEDVDPNFRQAGECDRLAFETTRDIYSPALNRDAAGIAAALRGEVGGVGRECGLNLKHCAFAKRRDLPQHVIGGGAGLGDLQVGRAEIVGRRGRGEDTATRRAPAASATSGRSRQFGLDDDVVIGARLAVVGLAASGCAGRFPIRARRRRGFGREAAMWARARALTRTRWTPNPDGSGPTHGPTGAAPTRLAKSSPKSRATRSMALLATRRGSIDGWPNFAGSAPFASAALTAPTASGVVAAGSKKIWSKLTTAGRANSAGCALR